MVAADEAGLPDEKPFRERLRSHLEFGTRVAMQDSDAESEARTAPTTGGSKEVPA
jgi:hemoglobin